MKNWTLNVIVVQGFPVKVYTDAACHQAYVFPLFGKYYGLHTDGNVLDFATDFLMGRCELTPFTHSNYLNSLEDTAVINIETVKAA